MALMVPWRKMQCSHYSGTALSRGLLQQSRVKGAGARLLLIGGVFMRRRLLGTLLSTTVARAALRSSFPGFGELESMIASCCLDNSARKDLTVAQVLYHQAVSVSTACRLQLSLALCVPPLPSVQSSGGLGTCFESCWAHLQKGAASFADSMMWSQPWAGDCITVA